MKNFSVSDKKKAAVEQVEIDLKRSGRESQGTSAENSRIDYKVEISWKTIALIMLIAAGLYIGIKLLAVLAILFFAFAVASALLPLVRKLRSYKIPKGLSIGIVYLLILVALGIVTLMIAQPLQSQLGNITDLFSSGFDSVYERIADLLLYFWDGVTRDEVIKSVQNFFTNDFSSVLDLNFLDAGKAVDTVAGLAAFLGYFSLSIVISVYIIADHDSFLDLLLLRVVDDKKSSLIRSSIENMEEQLGSWLRGQVVLSLIIGVLVFIFLSILGVPYALPLALLAGLLETIPTLGPVLASVPAILTALFALSPAYALGVTIGYLLLQWFENNLIVPKVMGNATGLKPVVVILAVFIGFSLFGTVGAIFAVPVTVIGQLATDFYFDYQKIRAEE